MKKIIFFSYHSLTVLKDYYDVLSQHNDCWWLVYNEKVYDEIVLLGYKKVVFKGQRSNKLFQTYKLYNFRLLKKLFIGIKNIIQNFSSTKFSSSSKLNFSDDINSLKPDIILSNTLITLENYKPLNNSSMTVYVFHSLCFKKYNLIKKNLLFDMVMLPSKFHYNEMIKRFKNNITPNSLGKDEGILSNKVIKCFSSHPFSHGKRGTKMSVVGWPRGDFFFKQKLTQQNKNKLLKEFNLNKNFKTFLYAPTWNAYYNLGLFPKSFGNYLKAFEEISIYMMENNINFIFKPHPGMSKYINDTKIHYIADKYNVHLCYRHASGHLDMQMENYLRVSDCLISDISGIITDFMILNRPIIFIEPDNEILGWDDFDLPSNFRAGYVANSIHDLKSYIYKSIKKPDEFSKDRLKVLNKIMGNMDGNSSERACKEILNYHKKFAKYK